MKGDIFNPSSKIRPQGSQNVGVGLTMGALLSLPPQQRRLTNWMIREKECTLAEAAEYLREEEQTAKSQLDALVQQGFLQEVKAAGSSRYYIKLAAKEGSQIAERLYQVQTPGKPLVTIISPSGEIVLAPGSSVELCITLSNQGNQSALIDIFIDEVSDIPSHWWLSSRERLALGHGQTSEVFFQIQVPVEAIPASYDYVVVVDARQHYPEDTPLLNPGRLRVMPLVQEARTVNDPTFTLQPVTSSLAPTLLQPGEPLEATALVYNRSDRVDQFRLTCPDLPDDWFRVIYPEALTESGLVVAADGLELNPGDTGPIQVLLQPPPGTLAGIYSPTIRLYSVNNPDLVLLDVLYLQLLPVYLLDVELLTVVGKVKNQAGLFELRLHNQSNTAREVVLRVKSADEAEVCTYTLTPAQVRLLPGESAIVSLQVQPNKSWWRRPFYGRLLNFFVEIEDTQQLPLTSDRFQGALMWEPRPWWQFLLLVLTVLGIIGVIIFLVWLFFPRAPVPPQIVEFAPGSSSYKEAEDEVVRLNWKISSPKQLQTLRIEGVSPEGIVISEPIVYDLTRGIPGQLKNFCSIQQLLICQNVPTDARKAGDYIFQMTLFTKRGKGVAAQTLKTSTVRIEPIPLPAIVEFASTKPAYEEVSKDTILVGAQGSASIQSSNTSTTANNSPQQADKSDSILLNWKIKNLTQLKALQLIGRAPDGSVNSPLKTYDFSQDVPEPLEKLCEKKEEELTCKNVPTDARKAGTYIFELIPVPKQEQEKPLESKKTDPIKINPLPIPTKIVEFKINGADALPKYLVEINPRKPIVLVLSWRVEGGKDIKVELLPSPGTVPPVGKIPFPLSQEPGTETITLQVTNEAKEQISKSVTIETFVSPPPPSPPPTLPSLSLPGLPPLPPGGGSPPLPVPAPPSPPAAASPSPSPSPSAAASPSPSTPGAAPPLPLPAGNSPPVPPSRDSPPPAELPPKLD
jgi:hypothetical protein